MEVWKYGKLRSDTNLTFKLQIFHTSILPYLYLSVLVLFPW